MQKANIAHVCTPGRVPILGEIVDAEVMLGHSSIKPKGLNSCDRWYGPDKDAWLRRRNAEAATAPPANWPGKHLRVLDAIQRTHDATADPHSHAIFADSYQYHTRDGQCVSIAHRHNNDLASKWECSLSIHDTTGAKWWRNFPAVTDDFGWLVEVPAC